MLFCHYLSPVCNYSAKVVRTANFASPSLTGGD
jgi:hypothetical protein